jgi:hypothetical protein
MNKTTNNLVTTNVRIPKEELLMYREYALSEGKSFSQLVRDMLAQMVVPAQPKKIHSKRISFWNTNQYSVKGGDPKASQSVDKYVYGI